MVTTDGVGGLARLLRLGAPVRTGEADGREVPLEVHADDGVELLLRHVEAHLVAQDPGVADEHVEPTERVDGLLHHGLGAGPARAVVVVRDALAAGGRDLVDDLLRGRLVGALTGAGAAEVVDDDLRALAREQQRLGAPDAAARARHDRDLAVEESHRFRSLCSYESGQRG